MTAARALTALLLALVGGCGSRGGLTGARGDAAIAVHPVDGPGAANGAPEAAAPAPDAIEVADGRPAHVLRIVSLTACPRGRGPLLRGEVEISEHSHAALGIGGRNAVIIDSTGTSRGDSIQARTGVDGDGTARVPFEAPQSKAGAAACSALCSPPLLNTVVHATLCFEVWPLPGAAFTWPSCVDSDPFVMTCR